VRGCRGTTPDGCSGFRTRDRRRSEKKKSATAHSSHVVHDPSTGREEGSTFVLTGLETRLFYSHPVDLDKPRTCVGLFVDRINSFSPCYLCHLSSVACLVSLFGIFQSSS
jgi:hypothetical protein